MVISDRMILLQIIREEKGVIRNKEKESIEIIMVGIGSEGSQGFALARVL
jgi:hypothetical protein